MTKAPGSVNDTEVDTLPSTNAAERDPPRSAIVEPGNGEPGFISSAHLHHVLVGRTSDAASSAAPSSPYGRKVIGQGVVSALRPTQATKLRPRASVISRHRCQCDHITKVCNNFTGPHNSDRRWLVDIFFLSGPPTDSPG